MKTILKTMKYHKLKVKDYDQCPGQDEYTVFIT